MHYLPTKVSEVALTKLKAAWHDNVCDDDDDDDGDGHDDVNDSHAAVAVAYCLVHNQPATTKVSEVDLTKQLSLLAQQR